ncbi:MAG: hypothetical protein WC602_01525 [archaeon]
MGNESESKAESIIELLDKVEKRTSDIISLIEDLRFIENEYNARKSEVSSRKQRLDSGEISGEVFKRIKEKTSKEFGDFEKERQENWKSVTDSSAEISVLIDKLKAEYEKRLAESGFGTIIPQGQQGQPSRQGGQGGKAGAEQK